MSGHERKGAVVWRDLTVPDAAALRGFYEEVVGWRAEPVPVGEYEDYQLVGPEGDEPVAGLCHARGDNARLPPQWLVYVTVADVSASVERCRALGGDVVDGPRTMGGRGFCVIRDPAGAVLALVEPAER